MDTLINKLIDFPFDITYIAIGSAVVRDINEDKDRQQFPPFLENIYMTSNKNIRIINIDMMFEKPYYLSTYLPNLICNDNNLLGERLDIYYLEETFKFDNNDTLELLNIINTIIMDQDNLLIFSDHTGRGLDNLEKYFYNLYSKTEYNNKFNELVCYDFNYNNENTCATDLTQNFPIIKNDKLVKFNFTNKDEFVKLINKNKEYFKLFQQTFVNEITQFANINLYICRNLINKNNTDTILKLINKSIFNKINIECYENEHIISILVNNLLNEYYDVIKVLFNSNTALEFNNIVISINKLDIYTFCNNFNKFLIYLKDFI